MWWLINLISDARRWRWTRFQLVVALLRKAWDILKKNVGTRLKLFWLRVFNIRNNIFSTMYFTRFSEYSNFFILLENFQVILSNLTQTHLYIFMWKSNRNHYSSWKNGCSNIFFWRIETNAWIKFRRKFFLFIHLIPIRMFRLLKL